MKTYTFDVKLFASIEIQAADLVSAVDTLNQALTLLDVPEAAVDGFNIVSANQVKAFCVNEDGEDENRRPTEVSQ